MRNRKIIFFFLNQNICCGYFKEPSQWDGSFEHPKHMLKIMGKKIFTILCWKFLFICFVWNWFSNYIFIAIPLCVLKMISNVCWRMKSTCTCRYYAVVLGINLCLVNQGSKVEISGFPQSVGWDFKQLPCLLRRFKTRTTAGWAFGSSWT